MKLQRNENAWIKMGRLYRRVPMLKHIPPLLIPIGIFSAFIGCIIAIHEPRPCTCDQHFIDDKLRALGEAGNLAVQNYLNHIDDYDNCAAKRALLLNELERKKQLQQ